MGNHDVDEQGLRAAIAGRSRQAQSQKKWGWIYFAASGDTVKIGASRRPGYRVSSIRTGNQQPVELVGVIFQEEHLYARENDVHQQFREEHIHGEWYRLSPRLITWMQRHTQLPPDSMFRKARTRTIFRSPTCGSDFSAADDAPAGTTDADRKVTK